MNPQNISLISFGIISLILLLFAFVILWKIYTGAISLDGLLAEVPAAGKTVDSSKASLSRFQFLIFTFVVAGLFLLLSVESGTFVTIPDSVLGLLGISAGSYAISKGIGNAKDPKAGNNAGGDAGRDSVG